MFKWKKDKISSKMTDTFIGEGTIVEGTIRSAGSLRLEGQLRGDISCEGDVILGESGFAVSNITANNVVLAGQVNGNVTITGKLTIMSTGKLYGNMTAASLTIEEGGLLQGSSAMDQDEPPAINPMERRNGDDRRVSTAPYKGPERRSGLDRRSLAEGEEVPAIPKKISYRAIEKPAVDATQGTTAEVDVAKVEVTAGAARENKQSKENNENVVMDPLRKSGRAFIHSMAGSTKESVEHADASRQANSRLNEGLNAEERAALSGILLAEAAEIKSDAAGQTQEELVDAAGEMAVGLETVGTSESESVSAVEAAEGANTEETSENVGVETFEVAVEAAVSAEDTAVAGAEAVKVISETLESENAESVELAAVVNHQAMADQAVERTGAETALPQGFTHTSDSVSDTSGNVYGYGFENRANAGEPVDKPAQTEHDFYSGSSNGRTAVDAADLLKNW